MSRRGGALALLVGGLLLSAPALVSAAPARPVASSEDIRDIRGPIPIPIWWRWLAFAGGAALMVALGGGLFVMVRRRRSKPLSPDQRALLRLEQALPLALAEQSREYALAASDAVRQYIEDQLGLRAAHLTTEEFLHDLVAHEHSLLDSQRKSLLRFLEVCDLAKFARFRLPREGLTALDETARRFVLATAPQPSQNHPSPSRTS